ncbi:odorant-binding protein-like [Thomomys bottae]
MKALLLVVLVSVAYADSEFSGPCRTLAILSDNPETIQEGGPLRGLFRHISSSEDGQSLTIGFFVKKNEECQAYTVVGIKNKEGVYTTDYYGKNFFQILAQGVDYIIFYNQNVNEQGRITHLILIAGKEEALSEQQEQLVKKLAQEKNIPTSSIQYVLETDSCPK